MRKRDRERETVMIFLSFLFLFFCFLPLLSSPHLTALCGVLLLFFMFLKNRNKFFFLILFIAINGLFAFPRGYEGKFEK